VALDVLAAREFAKKGNANRLIRDNDEGLISEDDRTEIRRRPTAASAARD